MWYRRHECGLRMSIFFSMATAAGAFGGLLARGISEMDGVGGKGGWAWIFILEGIVTFLVAIWAYWAFVGELPVPLKPGQRLVTGMTRWPPSVMAILFLTMLPMPRTSNTFLGGILRPLLVALWAAMLTRVL